MNVLRLHHDDNVGVVIAAEAKGPGIPDSVEGKVPVGHKVALAQISCGSPIVKLSQLIGYATVDIARGQHVHSHNCAVGPRGPDQNISIAPAAPRSSEPVPNFLGYVRADGRVGTRNYIAIVSTVNCSATVARRIAMDVERSGILANFPHIDGVLALTHGSGCGMTSEGLGYELLQRALWGHASHPNVAAAIFVGLGCEVMQVAGMRRLYGDQSHHRFRGLTIQASGGTRESIAAGVRAVEELLPGVDADERVPVPVSHLTLALQCGGSDGFSAITANPALGAASDILVNYGGSSILAETPEIFGAEQLLLSRSSDEEVGRKLIEKIDWWKAYTASHGATMDNNPSPGNKLGGLTTILEKSLGAVAKGGKAPLSDVLDYAERVKVPGLSFMDSPGFDPVSVTGQIAAGAQIVCFTTGRGSAFGSKPAPTLKLATTCDLYARMKEDMDIDCGTVLDGHSIEEKGREIFDAILDVASGRRTKSEELGLGDNEFVPWQIGAVV